MAQVLATTLIDPNNVVLHTVFGGTALADGETSWHFQHNNVFEKQGAVRVFPGRGTHHKAVSHISVPTGNIINDGSGNYSAPNLSSKAIVEDIPKQGWFRIFSIPGSLDGTPYKQTIILFLTDEARDLFVRSLNVKG